MREIESIYNAIHDNCGKFFRNSTARLKLHRDHVSQKIPLGKSHFYKLQGSKGKVTPPAHPTKATAGVVFIEGAGGSAAGHPDFWKEVSGDRQAPAAR